MADKILRSSGLKPGMLHGIVVSSTIDAGFILKTTIPELDSRFLTITAKDIPGSQTIDILEDTIRVFASTTIEYLGQPMMALFGPDSESVEVKARDIEVEYQLPGSDKTLLLKRLAERNKSFSMSWGNIDTTISQSASFVEGTYHDRRKSFTPSKMDYARCFLTDRQLKVEIATQWPFHVRQVVANVCGKPIEDVIVIPQPYFTTRDEYMVNSSLFAAIAALATVKAKRPVQLNYRRRSWKPAYTIKRKTFLDAEKYPIAEDISVMVDQGAVPLFSKELFNQMCAGLIPNYPLQALSIKLEAAVSEQEPAAFCGDLGYTAAIFSTEAHVSALAEDAKLNPAIWRLKYYTDNQFKEQTIATLPISKLKDLIEQVCSQSDFARHNAVYDLQRKGKKPLSIFLNYSRGIALSCAAGMSGFSTEFPLLDKFSISLTLEANDRVIINSSHSPTEEVLELWKRLVVREMGVGADSITLVDGDTSALIDSGPTVLLEDITRTGTMILACCNAIKNRRFKDPLPIREQISVRQVAPKGIPLFSSGYWGVLVLELAVNAVTLQVEVRHVWCRLSFASAQDKEALTIACRRTIISTIRDYKALLSFEKGTETEIDIFIEDQGKSVSPSSAYQALKGMIMAALYSALSQALNKDLVTLPVTGDDIIDLLRKSE